MFEATDFDELLGAFCIANFWEPDEKVDIHELAEALANRANRILREGDDCEVCGGTGKAKRTDV